MSEVSSSLETESSPATTSSSLDLVFGTANSVPAVAQINTFSSVASVTVLDSADVDEAFGVDVTTGSATESPIDASGEGLPLAVDCDHKGRVIVARFDGGQVSQFRYDSVGRLYAFTYSRLAWSTADGAHWIARDQNNVYSLEATVAVANDGSLIIETAERTRVLRLNGTIIDQYTGDKSGEITRRRADFVAEDLLATVEVRKDGPITSELKKRIAPAVTVPPPVDKTDGVTSLRIHAATAANRISGRQGIVLGKRVNRLRKIDDVQLVHHEPIEEVKSSFAETMAKYAVKVIETIQGPKHVALVQHLDVLAAIAHQQRKVDEARQLHERSLSIKTANFGADYADTGVNLHGLGRIYYEWGRYAEAEQNYVRAIRVFEKGLQKSRFLLETGSVTASHTTEHLRRYINTLHSLATLYNEQGMKQMSVKIYATATQACSSVAEEHLEGLTVMMNNLAVIAARAEAS